MLRAARQRKKTLKAARAAAEQADAATSSGMIVPVAGEIVPADGDASSGIVVPASTVTSAHSHAPSAERDSLHGPTVAGVKRPLDSSA